MLLTLLCALLSLVSIAASTQNRPNPRLDNEWLKFRHEYGKVYEEDDEHLRRMAWESNREDIERHNADYAKGLVSYKLQINRESDQFYEELKPTFGGEPSIPVEMLGLDPALEYMPELHRRSSWNDLIKRVLSGDKRDLLPELMAMKRTIATSLDYRDRGIIGPVRNQESCNSCWAFAACGVLIAQAALKEKTIDCSEQTFLNCVNPTRYGCRGGITLLAFLYASKSGVMRQTDEPYINTVGTCDFHASKSVVPAGYKFSYHYKQAIKNEDIIQILNDVGPVKVAIDSSAREFWSYGGGIYTGACSNTLPDHAVLLVGYGQTNGKKFWIIQNSKGTGWGEEGYLKLSRDKENMCCIGCDVSWAVLDEK